MGTNSGQSINHHYGGVTLVSGSGVSLDTGRGPVVMVTAFSIHDNERDLLLGSRKLSAGRIVQDCPEV